MSMHSQVCVIGGDIAGSLVACLLSDAGYEVAIVDKSGETMCGASRWNEGKIHLGFTYTGTPDLATARLMAQGAGAFETVLRRVTGESIPDCWWTKPVVYLVDKCSIFAPEVLWQRAQATAWMIAQMAECSPSLREHLCGIPLLTPMSIDSAMEQTAQGNVVAAWRTAERSVSPRPVADRIRSAVAARDIPIVAGTVERVSARNPGWCTELASGENIASTIVINASWESRPGIDRSINEHAGPCVIRYKVGLFATATRGWDDIAPSTRILGKFGDVTPYGDGDVYLSWYPAGFLARSDDGRPPAIAPIEEKRVRQATIEGLQLNASLVTALGLQSVVRGGYVVAHGTGDISETCSTLHGRDYPDAREIAPGFISIDTGKYTLGPMLAARAAELVMRR
jgi:hypothetical protein